MHVLVWFADFADLSVLLFVGLFTFLIGCCTLICFCYCRFVSISWLWSEFLACSVYYLLLPFPSFHYSWYVSILGCCWSFLARGFHSFLPDFPCSRCMFVIEGWACLVFCRWLDLGQTEHDYKFILGPNLQSWCCICIIFAIVFIWGFRQRATKPLCLETPTCAEGSWRTERGGIKHKNLVGHQLHSRKSRANLGRHCYSKGRKSRRPWRSCLKECLDRAFSLKLERLG